MRILIGHFFLFHINQRAIRPGSNVQNIQGIFQKLLHRSAAAHGQNIPWIIHPYAAVFVPFLYGIFQEYFAG